MLIKKNSSNNNEYWCVNNKNKDHKYSLWMEADKLKACE